MKKLLLLFLVFISLTSGCATLLPVISAFEVTPNAITSGSSANLIWNVSGANSVTIDPGLGVLPASGTRTVNPNLTTAYTISASGLFGTVTRSAVLVVNPAPIVINIDANPAVLMSGGSALLRWSINGATNISIDQGIGNVQSNGTQLISPTQTTTYTITASNTSGSLTKSVTVAVNPPIVADLSVNPSKINVGQSATLTWNITGADSATIDQGIGDVPAAGSRIVTPYSTTSYTLIAKSSCCIVSKAVIVNVGTVYPYGYSNDMMSGYPYNYYSYNPFGGIYRGIYGYPYGAPGGNQVLTPFIEIFNVNPNQVKSGQPVLLHWNVVGATSITITGIGNVPSNGSQILVPATTSSYTMTASNAYSSDSRSVTVNVVP